MYSNKLLLYTQTILSVNPWVIHRSKEFFGDDANEFNPERWLRPESRNLEKYYIPVSITTYILCISSKHIYLGFVERGWGRRNSFTDLLSFLLFAVRRRLQLLHRTQPRPDRDLQGDGDSAARFRYPAGEPRTELEVRIALHGRAVRVAVLCHEEKE